MSSMPKEMKAKWLQALRSGEYKQGHCKLYDAETGGFCCLGVLQQILDGQVEMNDLGQSAGLPSKKWAADKGIPVDEEKMHFGWCPLVPFQGIYKYQLSELNDAQYYGKKPVDFLTIANLIEDHVEGI